MVAAKRLYIAGVFLIAAMLVACGGNGGSFAGPSGLLPVGPQTIDSRNGPVPLRSYSEKVLTRFGSGTDIRGPAGGLIADANGALYGTALLGGSKFCPYGCGGVFKLTRSKSGYQRSILWYFHGPPKDGANPFTGLTADGDGSLYGTTGLGGAYGDGTVFKLTPSASGYTEQVLWNFDGTDGSGPNELTLVNGVPYGTANEGGAHGDAGVVFDLTPSTSGYTEQVLWNFGGKTGDGFDPDSGVVVDKAGAIYGTTGGGGDMPCPCGTVFKLMPGKNGYTEKILWNFSDKSDDGAGPEGLTADASGALYGATVEGGTGPCYNFGRTGCGTVFKLTPSKKGYAFSLLWSFGNSSGDGEYPAAPPTVDADGTLYGTTAQGGGYTQNGCVYLNEGSCGTVYKITPSNKNDAESVLWSFGGSGKDGFDPEGSPIIGPSGALYATTSHGGSYDCSCGTVFRVSSHRRSR